jgi:DNA polymerase-3 subunit gamma/tau
VEDIFAAIAEFTAASTDLSVFWQELIQYYRDMLVIRSSKEPERFLDLTEEELFDTRNRAECFTKEKLLYHIRTLEDAFVTMQRNGSLKRTCAEMTLVRLSDDRLSDSAAALLSRIATLEEKLASGAFTANPKPQPTDAEAPKKASPPAVTEAASEPEKPKTTPDTPMKPLPSWAEIAESIAAKDDGSAAMLRRGRGYLMGNKVVVKVGDHFSQMLLNTDEVKSALATAILLSGDAEGITPQNVSIIFEKAVSEEEDPLLSLGDRE